VSKSFPPQLVEHLNLDAIEAAEKEEAERSTFDCMKVAELKEELQRLGLATTGNKTDLIARLRGASMGDQHHEGEEEGAVDDPTRAMTNDQLRAELRRRRLAPTGNKADLQRRLRGALANERKADTKNNDEAEASDTSNSALAPHGPWPIADILPPLTIRWKAPWVNVRKEMASMTFYCAVYDTAECVTRLWPVWGHESLPTKFV
jgi:hypothetical protein